MSTEAYINEVADQVEAMVETRAIYAIRVGDCTAEERRFVIDHHTKVMEVLRGRGHQVKANVVHDDLEGETLTIRLADGPAWAIVESW